MSQSIDLALENAGADIVKRLGGHWSRERATGMCLCPVHNDRTPSLSVRVGDRSLLFKCFAGCDTIDVLRAIRRLRLDIPSQQGDAAPARQSSREWTQARVSELWDGAVSFARSPGMIYARGRGLIGNPQNLRYHPRTPLGKGRAVRFRPAVLAAVRSGERVIAVERLFLDPVTGLPAADLRPPKRMFGYPLDGAVRFGMASDTLGLAEGWETAWSAYLLLGFPVWACLGSERFPHVAIPDSVNHLFILHDDDLAGEIGAAKAMEAHARPDRTIEPVLPGSGFNDWNDLLRDQPTAAANGGEGVGWGVRKAA
ncbi:MAG: toprim domain-containing protein [Sphingobium sp.]|nr:toprim domain-containing protein [Sphingobium sp.]